MLYKNKVRVTVKEVVKGKCPVGHIPGESWLIEDGKTVGGICANAYTAIYPIIRTFQMGGEHPWDEDKNVEVLSCPDPKRLVLWEVRRLGQG